MCHIGVMGSKLYKDFQRWEKLSQRVFDITNQLLTRHSLFAPLGQVAESTSKPSRFSIQGSLSELSRIMAARTLKKSISPTDSEVQTFLKGEENKYRKEKPKVTYSVALVMAFLAAENENRQLAPVDFGRVPKRFLLSVRCNSITENFVYWKLRPLLFL